MRKTVKPGPTSEDILARRSVGTSASPPTLRPVCRKGRHRRDAIRSLDSTLRIVTVATTVAVPVAQDIASDDSRFRADRAVGPALVSC